MTNEEKSKLIEKAESFMEYGAAAYEEAKKNYLLAVGAYLDALDEKDVEDVEKADPDTTPPVLTNYNIGENIGRLRAIRFEKGLPVLVLDAVDREDCFLGFTIETGVTDLDLQDLVDLAEYFSEVSFINSEE